MAPAAAWAQAYPAKPVTMVVPWPAGGSTDVVMRAISEAAAKQLGQPIVIDNKPGPPARWALPSWLPPPSPTAIRWRRSRSR